LQRCEAGTCVALIHGVAKRTTAGGTTCSQGCQKGYNRCEQGCTSNCAKCWQTLQTCLGWCAGPPLGGSNT
jgi:hypothetical protein